MFSIMKPLIIVLLLTCAFVEISDQDIYSTEIKCNVSQDVTEDYRTAVYEFTVRSFRNIAASGSTVDHFIFAPLSAWLILAAIAEGTGPIIRQIMFKFLHLPKDFCTRKKYYQIASSRFSNSYDVNITSIRTIVIDEEVKIKPEFYDFVTQNSLLNIVSAPLKRDPKMALEKIRNITLEDLKNIDISGNSLIIDVLTYNGSWSISFEDAVVERSPFFNQKGEKIGRVDLMKVKIPGKVTSVPGLYTKVLELSIGQNERYRIIFGITEDTNYASKISNFTSDDVKMFLNLLQGSEVAIDIAIPRFTITTEYDTKKILEDFGLDHLWTDPEIVGNISLSQPAALPSSVVQRTSLSLDTGGLRPAPIHQSESTVTDQPIIGGEFIANRPFIFVLFDAETYTCITVAAFTKPTYND